MLFNDFIKKKFHTKQPANVKRPNSHEVMKQKVKEEKETYDLYQLFIDRDKQLYQLLLDIHHIKCVALTYLGEGGNLPTKPKHKAFPAMDIKPPRSISNTLSPRSSTVSNYGNMIAGMEKKNFKPEDRYENKENNRLSVNWGEVTTRY